MNRITFVEKGSEEWRVMWSAIGADKAERCRRTDCGACGEEWQYMGTVVPEDLPADYLSRVVLFRAGLYAHQFRHRHHPATGKREYRNIQPTSALDLSSAVSLI